MSIHLRLPYILNRILINLTQRKSLDVRQVKQCRWQLLNRFLVLGTTGGSHYDVFIGAIVNEKNRVCRYWRAVLVIFPNT